MSWSAPTPREQCHVSFCRADRVFGTRLATDLRARGVRCWVHEQDTLPVDSFWKCEAVWDEEEHVHVLCCSAAS